MADSDPMNGLIDECAKIAGATNVLTAAADKAAFEQDVWSRYRGRAAFVVRPGTTAEVSRIVAACARHGTPIVPQGGNTGLVAGGIPDDSGREVVLSLSRMNRIREMEPRGDFVVCEAGVILADLQKAAEAAGRYFPVSLGAEGSCQVGGIVATNAGGSNVLRYGMTRASVLGLEVVLSDGSVWNGLSPIRKDNTGYDLKQIFVGSEGTLGIVTAATLQLSAMQRETVTLWLALAAPEGAVELLAQFRSVFGNIVSSFELLHSNAVEVAVERLPNCRRPVSDVHPWHVLIELAWGFTEGLRERVEAFLEDVIADGRVEDGALAESGAQRENMWRIREGQSEAARHLGVVIRSDVAVSIERVPELLRTMESWVEHRSPDLVFLPFGHLGDGNMHCNCVLAAERLTEYEAPFLRSLYEEVSRLGGSISAEHGVGRLKVEAVAERKADVARRLAWSLKQAFDPDRLFNPGVVFPEDAGRRSGR